MVLTKIIVTCIIAIAVAVEIKPKPKPFWIILKPLECVRIVDRKKQQKTKKKKKKKKKKNNKKQKTMDWKKQTIESPGSFVCLCWGFTALSTAKVMSSRSVIH